MLNKPQSMLHQKATFEEPEEATDSTLKDDEVFERVVFVIAPANAAGTVDDDTTGILAESAPEPSSMVQHLTSAWLRLWQQNRPHSSRKKRRGLLLFYLISRTLLLLLLLLHIHLNMRETFRPPDFSIVWCCCPDSSFFLPHTN